MTVAMEVLGWTADREAALKRMWIDGLSCSQIARALGGGATRNAVIGKVHRMKLQNVDRAFVPPVERPRAEPVVRVPRVGGRGRRSAAEMLELARQHTDAGRVESATADRRRENGRTHAVAQARRDAKDPFTETVAAPEVQRLLKSEVWMPLAGRAPVPLVDLGQHDCKWPLGDPIEPGFGFCGLPREHDRTSYCAAHRRTSVGGVL